MTGQVNSLRSRLDASAEEAARFESRRADALERAEAATAEFTKLETLMASFDAGKEGLDEEYESANELVDAARRQAIARHSSVVLDLSCLSWSSGW